MGCSASQLEGFKSDDIFLEKKLLDSGLKGSFMKTTIKKTRSFRFSPPVDQSENCCDFCEYDDEIKDVRITRVTSAEPLSNIADCLDVSASLITIDSQYDLDEKFEMSHSAIISACHTSRNLHPADIIDTPEVVMTAYPHHGNPIIPFGYAVHSHGVSIPGYHADGATANGIHYGQHSPARNEGDCPNIDSSCDSIPSPTSVTGHSHFDAFSSPFSSAPTSPSSLSLATRSTRSSSTSIYDDNLHGISKAVGTASPQGAESSAASASKNDEENCQPSPPAVITKGSDSAVKPKISILTALEEGADGNEEVRDDDSELSPDAHADHDLPGHISLKKLKLPPSSKVIKSPLNKVILQSRIPFAHSPQISASDLNKGCEEVDDDRYTIKSNRSSRSILSRKDADAIRESVKTSVSKIEVLSKGRKPPALRVNTTWEADKPSRTALLQPLSPTRFPSRNIASVGRYGSSEKPGEVYIVGGFRDAMTSSKSPPPKVKDIVAKIQDPKREAYCAPKELEPVLCTHSSEESAQERKS
jgi:hypothetical protein